MVSMNPRAQTGLEYILTFGWIIVLVSTLITWIAFFAGASSGVTFSFSHNDLPVTGSLFVPGAASVTMQNNTGEEISISAISGTSYEGLTVNGQTPSPENPVPVLPLEEFVIEGTTLEQGSGQIFFTYLDSSGAEQSFQITAVAQTS